MKLGLNGTKAVVPLTGWWGLEGRDGRAGLSLRAPPTSTWCLNYSRAHPPSGLPADGTRRGAGPKRVHFESAMHTSYLVFHFTKREEIIFLWSLFPKDTLQFPFAFTFSAYPVSINL